MILCQVKKVRYVFLSDNFRPVKVFLEGFLCVCFKLSLLNCYQQVSRRVSANLSHENLFAKNSIKLNKREKKHFYLDMLRFCIPSHCHVIYRIEQPSK